MKTDILSLKSLYQFLTVNDYPIYSAGIISRKNHTGLTLTKFWQENILFDFRNRKCGKQIWKNSTGRNRYVSDICNRSERLNCYGEYADEIAGAANPENVLRQIQHFMDMLAERKYSYEVFCHKLPAYVRMIAEWDNSLSPDAVSFFRNAMEHQRDFDGGGKRGRAFFCGWFLTFFMLHALSGNGEGESALIRIRNNPALSIGSLYRVLMSEAAEEKKEVTFLTGKNSELCSAPLSGQHFFGREEELFELREMLIKGGKYLISGIGGIGKTELMRQMLKYCEEEALADYICVVQYEGGLMSSFVKAFPQIHGTKTEDNFSKVISFIRAHEKERVLIVIDNLDAYEEDKLAVLEALQATVFITSRFQEIKGFTTYQVGLIDRSAGGLIFRDNYRKALTAEDKLALSDILKNDIWRHTLILRMLGRAAAARGWTLQKLKDRLVQGDVSASVHGQDMYESLQQIYRRMYVDFGEKMLNGLLKAFAVLPYQSYTSKFAERFLAGFVSGGMTVGEGLERLYAAGRLEKHENRYSMHPFVAECVRNGGVREKDMAPFADALVKAWEDTEKGFNVKNVLDMLMDWDEGFESLDEELLGVTQLVPTVVSNLNGKCSGTLSELALTAYGIRYYSVGTSNADLERLTLIKKKIGFLKEDVRVVLCMLFCKYSYQHAKELEAECKILLESPAVSRKEKVLIIGNLGQMYFRSGDLEKALQMTTVLEEYKGEEFACEMICWIRVIVLREQGDLERYGEWLLRGYEAGKREGHEKGWFVREFLSALVELYYSTGQFEKAEPLLKELEENTKRQTGMINRMMLSFYQGGFAMYRGDEGFGVEKLEEACRLSQNLWPGVDEDTHAMMLAELGMACNKAGRREKAETCYQQSIAIYESRQGHEFDRYRVINNMSVMYLDWGKPEKALYWLERVRETACEMGGLGLAESSYNLSRVWQQLGDRTKELQYLTEAAPVLEQFYGGAHPKVTDAKNRLSAEKRDS